MPLKWKQTNSHVSFQAEPLVIDLKDLFQLIFNMRKKEAEGSKKVEDSFILDCCIIRAIKLQL